MNPKIKKMIDFLDDPFLLFDYGQPATKQRDEIKQALLEYGILLEDLKALREIMDNICF